MEIEKGTLTELVLERLRDDIVAGAYDAGQNLRIEMLKERYGTGASPLREALARLATEGFVVSETNRGFRVSPMSRDDLEDIALVRKTVESEALSLAIRNAGDEWEVGIVAALQRLKLAANRRYDNADERMAALESAHWQFHRAIIEGCGSPRLSELQATFYRQGVRYRRLAFDELFDVKKFVTEHESLAEELASRDIARATKALRAHIGITSEEIFPS
ncbi:MULTISPECIES: FCD domain-containing protein [Pandoraea]|uniref:GntR family transcriptional regulator n=1 Tax=Pandoraea TaxID=93217 RepID=UPI001F5E0B30|nr:MULTISPECIES: FCD domain-containing protein [Pandoraea]MCI3204989.1 GntR family transcriptional regulator [Pandoraea sp. LA3]MDN4583017.1 GntR family transcriptional regulator [Pandoraea capi]